MDEASFEAFMDNLLGDKLLNSFNEGGRLDFSELSYPDKDIHAQHSHLTAGMLAKEIERLESEAV